MPTNAPSHRKPPNRAFRLLSEPQSGNDTVQWVVRQLASTSSLLWLCGSQYQRQLLEAMQDKSCRLSHRREYSLG